MLSSANTNRSEGSSDSAVAASVRASETHAQWAAAPARRSAWLTSFRVVLARAHHDDGHCARISQEATPRMDAEFCRHASIHYHDAVHGHARRPWSQCLVKCREMSSRPDWRELLALKTAGRARALGSGSARRGAQCSPNFQPFAVSPARPPPVRCNPGPQGRRARGRIVLSHPLLAVD